MVGSRLPGQRWGGVGGSQLGSPRDGWRRSTETPNPRTIPSVREAVGALARGLGQWPVQHIVV